MISVKDAKDYIKRIDAALDGDSSGDAEADLLAEIKHDFEVLVRDAEKLEQVFNGLVDKHLDHYPAKLAKRALRHAIKEAQN